MKLFLYAVLLLAGFLAASLASFWLAVRPPRLVIPLGPADYQLTNQSLI